MIATKKCSKCKEVKPLTDFHSDKTNLDGKRFDCVACVSVRRRRYYADHSEAQRQYTREWRVAHPEIAKERMLTYHRSVAGKFAKLKCEAKRRGISVLLSLDDYVGLIEARRCHYCQNETPIYGYGIDRKDSSGMYSVDNCVPCCMKCNRIRGEDNITYTEMLAVASLLKQLRNRS